MADSSASKVLARYDDGSVALAEKRVGEGRVLVWTSTMDAFWNDLAQQPVFLPFIHQLVRYASGRTETVSSFAAGQILDVSDATAMATAGLGEVTEALAGSRGASGRSLRRGRAWRFPRGRGPRFLHLVEQGIYEIRPPGTSDVRPVAVAVNVDLGEADLAPLDMEEVVASISGRPPSEPTAERRDTREARLVLEDQERRQSLWRFLLMGAFVLLAVETVVSNRISRIPGRRGSHAG